MYSTQGHSELLLIKQNKHAGTKYIIFLPKYKHACIVSGIKCIEMHRPALTCHKECPPEKQYWQISAGLLSAMFLYRTQQEGSICERESWVKAVGGGLPLFNCHIM